MNRYARNCAKSMPASLKSWLAWREGRFLPLFLCLVISLCSGPDSVNEPKPQDEDGVSGSPANSMNVEDLEDIPPEIRLRDYRKQTRYPPNSRPALGESERSLLGLPGYNGSPSRDALIQGTAALVVKDGQAYLPVLLDVKKAGPYHIETLLHRGDGKACLIASKEERLEAGQTTVRLLLFGLAFHESCAKGPWHIEGVVGRKLADLENLAPGEAPDEAPLVPYKKRISIAIPVSRLSRSEWDSPTKRKRIAELEKEIQMKNQK